MKATIARKAVLVAAILVCSLPALAAKLVLPQVSGHVTAITANVSITIDGKQYAIAAGSPAATAVRSVQVGDVVGVMLDGPVGKATTHVTSILKQSN
ncbi:MAG TPA: hypothetical protein VNZ06_12850 [Steroidobacteraceae bacterium]|jgi:hypothetical protein|nr:hypothetical protein [Steroidobacteraceae bacterium]